MSKSVAFCWELGAGFGHLSRLRPWVDFFQREGFRISFIARDIWSAGRWFENADLKLFQAPFRHGSGLQFVSTPTFGHVLYNVGYGEPTGLFALASGWRSLLESTRPDVIIADHSPTAILAARGLSIPTVIVGSGFFCPPDTPSLSSLIPWLKHDPLQSAAVEKAVMDSINFVLKRWGKPPLDCVSQLYHEGTKKFLLTFEELDHFPTRNGERYWGYWPFQPGQPIHWPAGSGPKIFAYLKRIPHLPSLLEMLGRKPFRAVVHVGADSEDLQSRFQTSTLQIRHEMIDLADVGRSSDLAITNGNLGTTTAMLLSGVPVLCLPLHLEQLLIGKAVERIGAGAAVSPENIPTCERALNALTSQGKYQESAKTFAHHYRDFSWDRQQEQIEAELNLLLTSFP